MRRGDAMVDVKKLLDSARQAAGAGQTREWTASGVQVGRVNLGSVSVNGRQDTEDFVRAIQALLEAPDNAGQPAPAVVPAAPQEASPSLSEAIADHLGDLERRRLAPDTITESKHTLRIFLATTGDIPVANIKANHARTFLDAIRWWPERATVRPKYRDLSVLEIIEAGKRDQVPIPSAHTLNKHHQRLGAFLNALVNSDLLGRNPLKGLKADLDTSTDLDTGRPFTPEELAAIFEPQRFKAWASKAPHRWWGTMLGLYTGARVNEIAQIYLDDVREVSGVWGIFLWKSGRGQKIKNKSSIRFVPLAQPLLDAGFLQFVEDMKACGHPRMFPHLPAGTRKDGTPNGKGYGRQLSRQFGAYVKGLGIEKGTGFHAFRHTLSTMLAEVGVPSADIAMITGHAVRSDAPVLEKHYIHIAKPTTLLKRVETLAKFTPPVRLERYQERQFAQALRSNKLHP
ncbi:Phage integrase family protein [Lysobacter spongiicola DSM 21749]|uniref:Phage integrase family protein n=2 Tax=Novilysobacter TaxID=3382699 RepID=A0A1T4RYW9_9GAMM|nr:Phage integrase family protein [Lysobacter spongiicola DSM 21749]